MAKPMDKPKETPKRKKSKQHTKEETTRNFIVFQCLLDFFNFFFFKSEVKGIESDPQEISEKVENEEENLEKQRGSFDSKISEPGVERKEKQTPSEKGVGTPYKRSVKKLENKSFGLEETKEKQRAEETETVSKGEGELKKGKPKN